MLPGRSCRRGDTWHFSSSGNEHPNYMCSVPAVVHYPLQRISGQEFLMVLYNNRKKTTKC
ncbi:hypothetical protein FRX31_023425 [Thalictrum thalictroides]|uniref:Uncharacterized protein n=1 Tax=Thalictrum thalictroides TaxID=46969 RepID=A0A7J6VPF5_THATH|nr:hypothetical protein FRX31_023425 [Thalictrum thalictroides]